MQPEYKTDRDFGLPFIVLGCYKTRLVVTSRQPTNCPIFKNEAAHIHLYVAGSRAKMTKNIFFAPVTSRHYCCQRLLDPKGDGTRLSRNVARYLVTDTAQQPRFMLLCRMLVCVCVCVCWYSPALA